MTKNLGFVQILVLIPLFLLAIAAVAVIAGRDYYEKKSQGQTEFITQKLSNLKTVVSSYKMLTQNLETYWQYGVEIDQFATRSAEIADYIKTEEFQKAQGTIDQIASESAALYLQKKEAVKLLTESSLKKLETKIADYESRGVNVDSIAAPLNEVKDLIFDEQYLIAREKIGGIDKTLDGLLAAKIEADRKAAEAAAIVTATAPIIQTVGGATYERKTVSTPKGSFTVNVLTMNLSSVKVVTDTANSDNCYDNCPTKSLSQYVSDNGGFAGIHGTYFCPPDYANCAGKINSYDFPVYNSNLGKFLNADKLFWNGRGMIAFNGQVPMFFREANSFGGSVTAALANYPSLLSGGQIAVDEGAYPTAGTRGAIGYGGNTLFAVIGSNISIANMAYVMQSLGAQNALNLDGGGSAAMYFNGYKVGPGRSLPNAIVFK